MNYIELLTEEEIKELEQKQDNKTKQYDIKNICFRGKPVKGMPKKKLYEVIEYAYSEIQFWKKLR